MGLPFVNHSGEDNGFGSVSFGNDGDKTPLTPLSHNSPDSESMVMKSLDSGAMRIEKSSSLEVSTKSGQINNQCSSSQRFSILHPCSPKHEAAIKLQKVYKSFRTRRKLADCAVLVEQSWWKLLDFAELKRSSISFFEIEKHETAISRWSRARTRAAKVGKGLSKNDKARKLALQHWLEAIDPRHRYGHNLHFYYINWLHSHSREPFFYWLDIGEGREVNLVEKCPRLKLQQQCIKYLGPMEREVYEVVVENGKFLYKQTGERLHANGDEDAKWIFVLSTSKTLYVGKKKKGTFQHSSFLAGGATTAAGRLVVDNGTLKAVWPHSGHYRPTEENFKDFVSFLEENNVDLSDVKMSPVEEDEDLCSEQRSNNHSHFRNKSSGGDLILQQLNASETEVVITRQVDSMEKVLAAAAAPEHPEPSHLRIFSRNLTSLEIPGKGEFLSTSEAQNPNPASQEEEEERIILQRIQKTESYQLGKQLSCRWTTGAGPRIGCVRDYPAELQVRALEQLCLSPRSAREARSCLSRTETASRMMRSSSVPEKGVFLAQRRSIGHSVSWMQASSPLCREKMENYSISNKTMIDDLISF